MIPVRLKLHGLYSYQIEQEINFTKLTEPQVFGIFGPVGAGKSAILEAVILALYGELDRLGKRDNYLDNALNSKCKKIVVEFEFFAGKGNLRHFRFSHIYDASRKNPVTSRKQLEKVNGIWQACDIKAEDVIGLSLQNFRRTVIIPQGKFKEFLSLQPKDRTTMLQEIFDLQKYDLTGKTKRLLDKTKNEIEVKRGEIERLQSSTPEDVKTLRKREKDKRQEHEKLKKTLAQLNQTLQEMEQLKSLDMQIREEKKIEAELLKKESDITALQKFVQEKELCQKKFGGHIEKLNMVTADFQKLENELQSVMEIETKKKQLLKQLQEQYAEYKKEYEQRNTITVLIEDLQKVININNASGELSKVANVLKQLEQEQQNIDKNLKEVTSKLMTLRQKEKQLRKKVEQHSVLVEIKNWYTLKQQINNRKNELSLNILGYREEIEKIETDFLNEVNSDEWQQVIPQQMEIADFEKAIEALDRKLSELSNQQQILQKNIKKLSVQERLLSFAQELKAGEPCPLCGALEHPNPLSGEHCTDKLRQLEQESQNCDDLINRIRDKKQAWMRLADRIDTAYKQLQQFEAQLDKCENELQKHIQQYKWQEYELDNEAALEEAFAKVNAAKNELQQCETEIEKLEDVQQTRQQEQEVLRKKLTESQQQHTALQSKLKTLASSLKKLDTKQYVDIADMQIQQEIAKLQQKQIHLEKQYQECEQALTELTNELAGLQGQIGTLITQKTQKENALTQLEKEIDEALKAFGYSSLSAVKDILESSLDVNKAKDEIETFFEQLREVRSVLKQLNTQMGGKKFDESELASLTQKRDEAASIEDHCRSELAQLSANIKSAESNMARIKDLNAELKKLDKRLANLKLLEKMFVGRGFVKYVSMHFLNQICALANKRFKELTDYQLALETDENGFVVRDFLQEGKRRLVKTLSGGQTFQAALCLALALSDMVHSSSKASHNLFFLDEGFGSLDNESLTKVFDTLKSLRNQHRILGVISHVDSLQQEMDVYLKIHNDPVRGSIITPSWEMD
jgi:exonuclease SbcC